MTRRFLTICVTLSVCVAGATLPSIAPASPGWTVPADFLLPGKPLDSSVRVGYQKGGTATVAYLEIVSESPLQTVLHVGAIPVGGTYQEQLRIASSANSIPVEVELAEAVGGAAVLQWAALRGPEMDSSPLEYLASYRAGGSDPWETPATLTEDATRATGIDYTLVPAISADGTAAAGVEHLDPTIPSPGGYRIDVAVHTPAGSWGPSAQISPASDSSESLALGFDANGDLTAAFRRQLAIERYALDATRRPATSGVWGSLEDLSGSDANSQALAPQLGVGPDGSAVIAFQYIHYTSPETLDVNALTRTGAVGSWTAPVNIEPYGAKSEPLAAGVSPDDTAYVLYASHGSGLGEGCVGAVKIRAGNLLFSSPQCVSPTGFEGELGGMGFLGNEAYFVWSGKPAGAGDSVVEASHWIDGGGRPDSFTDLEAPGEGVSLDQVVPDEDGSMAAFWSTATGSRTAAFDGGGPNLLGIAVPAGAVAGQSVAMSASFVDLWSGLEGPPSWSFGDGSGGEGAQVNHVFSRPGVYTVTVTASDVFGNQTTSAQSIAVAPKPLSSVPLKPFSPVPALKVLATKLVGQSVVARLSCAIATCDGGAALTVRERLRSGRPIELLGPHAKTRKSDRIVTVGAAGFKLSPGQTRDISVALDATGRKLLTRFGKLPVTLTVVGRAKIATERLTIRRAKARIKHRRG